MAQIVRHFDTRRREPQRFSERHLTAWTSPGWPASNNGDKESMLKGCHLDLHLLSSSYNLLVEKDCRTIFRQA